MEGKPRKVLTTREAKQQLPSLLATFRTEGADVEPVVFGTHRRAEGVVLSYARYLQLLDGRDRVRAILDDRTAAGVGMDEEETMRLALEAQAAARRERAEEV